MNMVMNNAYDYNQNGQTVENQLYYTNDVRIQQYKASGGTFLFQYCFVIGAYLIGEYRMRRKKNGTKTTQC